MPSDISASELIDALASNDCEIRLRFANALREGALVVPAGLTIWETEDMTPKKTGCPRVCKQYHTGDKIIHLIPADRPLVK